MPCRRSDNSDKLKRSNHSRALWQRVSSALTIIRDTRTRRTWFTGELRDAKNMSPPTGYPNPNDLHSRRPVSSFLRAVLHIVVGAVAGACLGIIIPVGSAMLMTWQDPVGMKQGGGTPFAIMLIVTVPLGAIFGAVWGFTRLYPGGVIAKKGPPATISEFKRQIAHHTIEDQLTELQYALPTWLRDFRRSLINRGLIIVVLLLLSPSLLFLIILAVYVWKSARFVQEMRTELISLKSEWGDGIFDRCGPLPFLLRSVVASRDVTT